MVVDGVTLVATKDGRVLKSTSEPGPANNMFAITPVKDGYDQIASQSLLNPFSNLIGSHKFKRKLSAMFYFSGCLFICFAKGGILKINGIGGGGKNCFAVIENSTSNIIGSSGYNYFEGYQHMTGEVIEVTLADSVMFISTDDERMMKINGPGGGGQNMFAIQSQTNSGYISHSGFNYLLGSARFADEVEFGIYVRDREIDSTMFSFRDGRVLKVSALGGTGQNMFNVVEVGKGFLTSDPNSSIWLEGSDDLDKGKVVVKCFSYGQGELFSLLDNDRIMKHINLAGTGQGLYNTEINNGSGVPQILDPNFSITLNGSYNLISGTCIIHVGDTILLAGKKAKNPDLSKEEEYDSPQSSFGGYILKITGNGNSGPGVDQMFDVPGSDPYHQTGTPTGNVEGIQIL